MSPDPAAVRVLRGAPCAEELAALIAVLCAQPASAALPIGYDAWRARRLATLRESARRP